MDKYRIFPTDSLYEFLVRMTPDELRDACRYPEFKEACKLLSKETYDVQQLLGAGSFGKVYKSHKRGEQHALKMFEEENDNIFEDVINEIAVISLMTKCNSKYCVPIIQLKTYPLAMVLPLAISDLNDYMETYKEVDQTTIITSMINGLRELHTFGIIHRDVKPRNYLVFSDNAIKISDFGMSTAFPNLQECYTVPYRSPKIWEGDNIANKSSDLWALGVSILEVANRGMWYDWKPDRFAIVSFTMNLPTTLEKVIDTDIRTSVMEMLDHKKRHSLKKVDYLTLPSRVLDDYSPEHKKIVMEWLADVRQKYKYSKITLRYTLDLFSRFLAVKPVSTTVVQGYSIACMVITTRITEQNSLTLKRASSVTAHSSSISEIYEYCLDIIRTLDGLLWLPLESLEK